MKLESQKVLVTGGLGFIGSHLCEKLVNIGSEVVILDDFSVGTIENIETVKKDVDIIKGKVENYKDVSKAMKGCDIVIHEAFPYGKSGLGLEEQYIEDGVLGTFMVLKAAVKNRVEKVVNASSVAVYGVQKETPVKEDQLIAPFLPYGATKYVGELYCQTFSNLYGLDTTSLRYFYVYGARYSTFDHNAMVNFLNRALEGKDLLIYGDGNQIRDYTYIKDVVEGTLLATKKEDTLGEVYNISFGSGKRIIDLANTIKNIVNKDVNIKFAEPKEYKFGDEFCKVPWGVTKKVGDKWIDERNYIGDISKAKKDLKYCPKIKMEEGIELTAKWLKQKKGL